MTDPMFSQLINDEFVLILTLAIVAPYYVSIRPLSRPLRCRINLVRVNYPATLHCLFSSTLNERIVLTLYVYPY